MTMVWILKCTAILSAGWLAAFLLRRNSAAVRFATQAAALAAILALPLVELALPRWTSPGTVAGGDVVSISAPMDLPAPSVDPGRKLQLVWLVGVAAMLLHAASGYALSLWRPPAVPSTVGLFRPRVMLPAGAEAWEPGLLRSVLLHEQAHIARRDPAWNLVALLSRSLYWFHPLVWLSVRKLQVERERACDDMVLAAGVRPSTYANHLVTCARMAGAPAHAALPMAGRSNLGLRVEAVVSVAAVRTPVSSRQRVWLAIGCTALLLPLAALGAPSIQVRSFSMFSKIAIPLLAAASAAHAADLSGRVYDASNATVPKAQLILRNQATAAELKATSGPAGEYRFDGLPAAAYELEVLMPGFARYQRRGIRLSENSGITLGVILKLGEVQETVQVNAPGQARPQQARPPQRIQVGGSVRPVRLLKQVRANYPEPARAEGREGNVTLRAVIGTEGTIVNAMALPGADPDLAEAAEQAVRQWLYEPTLLNGKPVETVTTIEINFRLGAN